MTTTYTFEQLKEDVRKEAEALRQHATKEERERLDFNNLRAVSPSGCIYGQMTKNCYSDRAAELIKACTPVFIDRIFEAYDNGIEGVSRLTVLREDPDFIRGRTKYRGMGANYSAIEAYILLPEAKNANLIAYLKGENDNLEL